MDKLFTFLICIITVFFLLFNFFCFAQRMPRPKQKFLNKSDYAYAKIFMYNFYGIYGKESNGKRIKDPVDNLIYQYKIVDSLILNNEGCLLNKDTLSILVDIFNNVGYNQKTFEYSEIMTIAPRYLVYFYDNKGHIKGKVMFDLFYIIAYKDDIAYLYANNHDYQYADLKKILQQIKYPVFNHPFRYRAYYDSLRRLKMR